MHSKNAIDEYLSDTLVNKLIESNVPEACIRLPCILGIDEAGRGPVLGPMTYAIAYYPQNSEDVLAKMKFADSKTLTESTREKLFEALQTDEGGFRDLGYMVKIVSPNMISNSMLRRQKYNLNSLSHDTAIDLIKSVESKGVRIGHVYIDTVGDPLKYKAKLQKFFPKTNFTVAEKADSKYPIVSAASICAKVVRDRIVQNWTYLECDSLYLDTFKLGCGYPNDADTKKFLERSKDPVFGFATIARFSWSTITRILDNSSCKCDWNEPEGDKEDRESLLKERVHFKKFFTKKDRNAKSASPSLNVANIKPKVRTNADVFLNDRLLTRVKVWSC